MRRVTSLLSPTLVACYLAIILAGPALHEFPGLAHEPTLSRSTDNHGESSAHSEPQTSEADSHCLICHFLAQGQITTERCTPGFIEPAVYSSAPLAWSAPRVSHWCPACPRAPPISASDIS
jgi:hypothetical protein